MAIGSIHFVRFHKELSTSIEYCELIFFVTTSKEAVFSQTEKSCIKSGVKYLPFLSASCIASVILFHFETSSEIKEINS
jgi:hypothetical protein